MDADFSHHPRYLPSMLDLSRERDLVIGSRYVPGGGTLNCTARRRALSQGANAFAKVMLGLRAQDCTAGFRCYRREVLQAIDLDSIRSNGYSFLIEMISAAARLLDREVPIIFKDGDVAPPKSLRAGAPCKLFSVSLAVGCDGIEARSGAISQMDKPWPIAI
jgi:dolichol-phosphate mannosyltransferase